MKRHLGDREQAGGGFTTTLFVAVYAILVIGWLVARDYFLRPSADYPIFQAGGFIFITGIVLLFLVRHHQTTQESFRSHIRNQDEQLRGIVETIANGIVMVDLDDRITFVNRAFLELFGYTEADLIGRSTAVLEVPGQPGAVRPTEIHKKALAHGRWSGEVLRRARDGKAISVQLSVAPIHDDAGQVVGFIGDYRDLRDVKEAREHLEGLGSIIEELAQEMDVDNLGPKALSAALMITGADIGGIAVLEGEAIQYRWQIGMAHDEALLGALHRPFRADEGMAGKVLATQQSLVVDDYQSFEQALSPHRKLGLRSALCAPILIPGECVGVVSLGSLDADHGFDESHVPLVEAIARQIGIALQRQRLIDDVRDSEARFRQLVETVPDIVYLADFPSFEIRYASAAVKNLLGFTPEQATDDPYLWWKQMEPSDRKRIQRSAMAQLEESDEYAIEYRLWHHDGRTQKWFEDRGNLKRGPDGEPQAVAGVLVDITERKRAEERLEYLAYYDRLTGLPNRTGLLDQLAERIDGEEARAGAGVAFYIDVDRFHLVNDILGHEAGDQLIIQVARRLQATYGPDAVVARPNADEFVVFVDDTCDGFDEGRLTRAAQELSEAFVQAMKEPIELDGQDSYVTVSIGVALLPNDADDSDTLVKHAHRAMCRAKEMGRGGTCFYAGELAKRQQKLLSLNTRLHQALERDEFMVYYQPIIDLEVGELVGVEALLRWQDPEHGMVSPGVFIPVAEETGLIVPIGDWVLDEVCRQIKAWRDKGIELYSAINLSARQLWREDTVENILDALSRHGLDPDAIELEITESTTMMDPGNIAQVLEEMRDQGLRVSIDDFGTGYSSLERLKHMPVRTLKIDRSFVNGVPGDERDTDIVTTVIQLASNFRMFSLAEGIETKEQWRFLRGLNCPLGQGYYFSRPVPADEIEKMWIQDKRWSLDDPTGEMVRPELVG